MSEYNTYHNKVMSVSNFCIATLLLGLVSVFIAFAFLGCSSMLHIM